MKHFATAIAVLSLTVFVGSQTPSSARIASPGHRHVYYAQHSGEARSILAAITRKVNSDLHKDSSLGYPRHVPFALSNLDVQGSWAHTLARPLRYRNRLDPILVLLHKEGGIWQVKQYGGGLSRKGVPTRLWKRWGLLRD